MGSVLISTFVEMLEKACLDYAVWHVRRKVDQIGQGISEIVAVFDDDGDGVYEREESVFSFDVSIPTFTEDGYCICNKGEEIGLGMPKLELVDAVTIVDRFADFITGNGTGYRIDGDTYIPLPFDFSGDGLNDWGRVLDEDDNGIPDASEDVPFYPVGSSEYSSFTKQFKTGSDVDIVLVSPEGEIAVYDRNGNIKAEDVDNAYALWVSENGIMDKKIDNYTVTEGLLFLTFIVSLFGFFGNLFRNRRVQ